MAVQHAFEYTAKDGRLVSIKPEESYILVSKTNEHWWHVRKDQHSRPFYVPAQYVKELPSLTEEPNKLECVTNSKPVDIADITRRKATTVIPVSAQDNSRETYRFSTFGLCEIPHLKPCETLKEGQTTSFQDNIKTHNSTEGLSFPSAPLNTDSLQLYAKPYPVPKVKNRQKQAEISLQDDNVEQTFEDLDFPLPPDSPIYDTIPEINIPEFDTVSELPAPVASNDILMVEQQDLDQTAEATSSADTPPTEQVSVHFQYYFFLLFSFLIL